MQKNRGWLYGFLVLALVQLVVPANMIWQSERVLRDGTPFKFLTAPIDPTDPFRGKYIVLDFEADEIKLPENEIKNWKTRDELYVSIINDQEGFAAIKAIYPEPPKDTEHYIKARVDYIYDNKVFINYPFQRFYMEESKAKPAEDLYFDTARDTSASSYALVYVKNGQAALSDVQIDGISFKELIEQAENR